MYANTQTDTDTVIRPLTAGFESDAILRKRSTSIYYPFHRKPLHPPIESAQFTSWAFSERVKGAGLALSMGRVGDAYDNAMMEAFWGRMQTELLSRKRWHTRLQLANAIFEYVEIFHNRKRRHSALGMLTPNEYETLYHQQQLAA
jgi:putative transposase